MSGLPKSGMSPEFDISQLVVTRAQIDEAYKNTPQDTIDKIKEQIELARKFHEIQRKQILDCKLKLKKAFWLAKSGQPLMKLGYMCQVERIHSRQCNRYWRWQPKLQDANESCLASRPEAKITKF